MGDQSPEIEGLGAEVVRQRTPEGRREGCDNARGPQDGADPEKRFFERIGADIQDVERQKDIDEIERGGCPELRKRDENQISVARVLEAHLYSTPTKIWNSSIVEEQMGGVKGVPLSGSEPGRFSVYQGGRPSGFLLYNKA